MHSIISATAGVGLRRTRHQRFEMVRTRFHVMPQHGHWRIARIGEAFKGPYPTRDEAIEAARVLALLAPPSQVLVHDLSGRVDAEHYYGHPAAGSD
jgi:hypothetical protein